MTAYYNEFDPYPAQWLRNLILEGLIAPGDVDERSIADVLPSDLAGYRQCHFFAGIGVWSYGLRLAGFPDSRPIWTASCPCQPFSAAGEGGGFDDERHLFPALHWLIEECRPELVVGEQVASKAAEPWLDLVQADMEGLDYAFGATAFTSASVGAPHQRDRTYWLGYTDSPGPQGHAGDDSLAGRQGAAGPATAAGLSDQLGNADGQHAGRHGRDGTGTQAQGGGSGSQLGRVGDLPAVAERTGGLANTDGGHTGSEWEQRGGQQRFESQDGGSISLANADSQHQTSAGDRARSAESRRRGALERLADALAKRYALRGQQPGDAGGWQGQGTEALRRHCADQMGHIRRTCPDPSDWRNVDWLFCRDGKWRPVEPGTFPLANGVANRVGQLRAYGNAVNAVQVKTFIEAVMECRP